MASPNRSQQLQPGAHLPYHSTRDQRSAAQTGTVRLHPPPSLHRQISGEPPLLSLGLHPTSSASTLGNTQSTLPPLLAPELPFPSQASNAGLSAFLPSSGPKWTKEDSKASSSSSSAGVPRKQKFQRTRTGCLVCRRRKVKCSQDGLPCRQCRIGNRDCHYDESQSKQQPARRGSASSSSFNATQNQSQDERALERRLSLQNASTTSSPASDPSLYASAGPFRGLMIPPFVQPSLSQSLPSEPLGPLAAAPAYDPSAASSSNVPHSSALPFVPYDPSAAARFNAMGSATATPDSASIVQWQNGVQMPPPARTYPPLPNAYAQEDPHAALDPRMYLPR